MFWNNYTGIKSTTANAYIEAFNRTNLHILTHSMVQKVLLDGTGNNTRAYGVLFSRNGTQNLVANASREVIVSAGNSKSLLCLKIKYSLAPVLRLYLRSDKFTASIDVIWNRSERSLAIS